VNKKISKDQSTTHMHDIIRNKKKTLNVNMAEGNDLVFRTEKHIGYIQKVSSDTESFEYLVTQHLRMSGVYWGLTSAALLGINLKQEPSYTGMIDWIIKCQDVNSGG
jgi:prenyltransferase beta subunit